MPLNGKMKTYIDEQVAAGQMDRAYADRLAATMGDAPDTFQGGWLRQADYDRQMAETRKKAEEWKEYGAKVTGVVATKDATIAELQTKVSEFEAKIAGGLYTDDQDAAMAKQMGELKQMITGLSGAGFITKADLDKSISDAKMSAIGFMGDHQSAMDHIRHKHFTTFGRPMTPQESDAVITFANEQARALGRNVPMSEAYDAKYAKETQDKWIADKTAEIERDVKTRMNVPAQGGGGGSVLGPLQVRMEEWKGGKDLAPGNDTLGEAKAKAAAALRAGGAY